MSSVGEEPLDAAIDAATRGRGAASRHRHGLVAPYPGVEDSTMSGRAGRRGGRQKVLFILLAAVLVWAGIIAVVVLVRSI